MASTASAMRRTARRWGASSAPTRTPPAISSLLRDGAQRRRLRGHVGVERPGRQRGGIYGQRYAADGTPVGSEFRANTYTAGDQLFSSVTALNDGGFVVTWSSFTRTAATMASTASAMRRTAPRWAASSAPTRTPPATRLLLRDGAQRRRLRRHVVVVRPGRQRLWHLRPALCGGRHPGGQRVPVNQITSGHQIAESETVATLADGRLVQVWAGQG